MVTPQNPPTLDAAAVARWQRIAPANSPWLHEEVAGRMLDRLQWIKFKPKSWAHWGAVRGGLSCHAQLVKQYPDAVCFVAEDQLIRAQAAIKLISNSFWQSLPWTQKLTRFEVPPPASVDMLWANMALHETPQPQALLARWHQALRVDGFLMFSCLGPDTAIELREVYRTLGWPPAGHDLTDMHDWGDMLVGAGFAEPVMDMERITLTYDTPARLIADLAAIGRNFHLARFAHLRGRGFRAQLEGALAKHLVPNPDGRLALTFEVIYGHALKPLPKIRASSESVVSIQDMRSMLGNRARSPD